MIAKRFSLDANVLIYAIDRSLAQDYIGAVGVIFDQPVILATHLVDIGIRRDLDASEDHLSPPPRRIVIGHLLDRACNSIGFLLDVAVEERVAALIEDGDVTLAAAARGKKGGQQYQPDHKQGRQNSPDHKPLCANARHVLALDNDSYLIHL